jgi:hypothetical protein
MIETPVTFGADDSLVGVVCTPGTEARMAPVACLMLNMGANYRIGPRRINVKAARRLADLGVSSIRFDLAGLGDSGASGGGAHFMAQVVLNIQQAMSLVEAMTGIRRFIVLGLCSGASNGMAAAMADPRIVGLTMFDGYAFPGRRARLELDLRRALAALGNPAMLGKTWRWLQRKVSPRAAAAAAPANLFAVGPHEDHAAVFDRAMTALTARGVAMLLVYSGTMHVRDRGRDQLGPFAAAPYAEKLEYRFIGEIDHNLTSLASQRLFIDVFAEWAVRTARGRPAVAAAGGPGRLAGNDSVPLASAQSG